MANRARSGIVLFVAIATMLISNHGLAVATVDPTTQPARTLSPFSLKYTNLEEGATNAYRPWFENGAWQGDIIEYDITSNGTRTTDVVVGATPASAPGSNWSARATFAAKEAGMPTYWTTNRKVITSTTGINQVAFRWGNLTDAQKAVLDPATAISAAQSDRLDFVRGDRSNEGSGMRTRYNLLGDIVNGDPVYVGKPTGNFTLPGYAAFKDSAREGRIYAPANDGMLHVFDEDDGSEIYAYVPSMLFPSLNKLTITPYLHTYFVDGALGVGDARIGSSWKTFAAAGMGAGAKGMYILDITNPDLSNETLSSGDDKKVMYEKDGVSDADLGYIHGAPSIVRLPNGVWYAITGNGYASTDGDAVLYLVKLSDGSVSKMTAASDIDNGLSAPTFVDVDYDDAADYAYAGDIKGNLWRFDLSNLGSTPTKLFAGGADKPITAAPDVGAHPDGDLLIYFGTGSLLSSSDAANTQPQSIYAIWDRQSNVSDTCSDGVSGDLLCQTLSETTASGTTVRLATSYASDWTVHKGWRVDLPESGERLLYHPRQRGGRLQFITTNTKFTEGKSWLLGLDYLTGGEIDEVQYDVSGDGNLDAADSVDVGGTSRFPVGLDLGQGNLSAPTFARISGGIDVLFINGLILDYAELGTPCTGLCEGGFQGGHVDVDTDLSIYGDTDHHTHEYDDKFNLTYMDYFTLEDGQNHLQDSIDGSEKLVALIANADLSTGGIIIIGDKQWNVVEYQKMVQQKLEAWDGVSPLLDDDGAELSFTLDGVQAAGGGTGTVRMSFDDQAIIAGGLVPSVTGCVRSSSSVTNGRWRNAALTLHVIDLASIDAAAAAADKAYLLQNPTDLLDSVDTASGTITLKEDADGDGTMEIYGGLIASEANPPAVFYEATLFWHYNGACYGEPSWESDWDAEILTDEEIAELADTLNSSASFLDILDDLNGYTCAKYKKGKCDDRAYKNLLGDLQDILESLLPDYGGDHKDLAEEIADAGGIGGGDGGGGDAGTSDGSAAETIDVAQEQNPVLGPNFESGRRSWIDLGQ